ncbi:MAG TPA: aminotransferase class I/II-fold pyridoxal phosphate-dependent enzyme [Thermoanaerobaculia bacterium]|nr:aminotransferase class I/II-fold pyridoxal phosphate-dependent enzyme [Thermoanaerobaculia bacterium]
MEILPEFGDAEATNASLSSVARDLVGSEILRMAAEVRARIAAGDPVCNLTVGDFDPRQFPIPELLREATREALARGGTNYPPSDGMAALREAVVRFTAREQGLRYPVDAVLVASGARPLIYGAFRATVDPQDVVVYAVPSWNNNHYVHLAGARAVELPVHESSNFFPTAAQIRPHLATARLLLLNSPLNPTGTVISREALAEIASLVVEENRRREAAGRRALFLLWDQVYGMLTFHGAVHAAPVGLVPEAAPYTILLDAVSKSFAATGLRVGWGLMPPPLRARAADLIGHVGAWAPRAEQLATAALLDAPEVYRPWQAAMKEGIKRRLDLLYDGLMAMKSRGLPVDAIEPQGAIYLSAHFRLVGRSWKGEPIRTNEQIRRILLEEAGFAVVPFQAFGLAEETGWFRLSVGAVSPDEIARVLPRVAAVLGGAS